jgi:hypothetical protein
VALIERRHAQKLAWSGQSWPMMIDGSKRQHDDAMLVAR